MGWMTLKTLGLPAAATTPITTAVSGITSMLQTVTTGLTLVKGLSEALVNLVPATQDATQIAVHAAIATVQSLLKSLTEDTGLYVLFVPPKNKIIVPTGVLDALSSISVAQVTAEGLSLQASFDPQALTPEQAKTLRNLFSATGGNDGFLRAVIESFDDRGDASRPVLTEADAVAGVYIVAGALDIASLVPFTNGLSTILMPGRPTSLDSPEIPHPQNLCSKIVPGNGVRLNWSRQPTTVNIPVLNTHAQVKEIAIIRSTSVRLLSAKVPQELFGTNQLTATTTGTGAQVLETLPGTDTAYVDLTTHTPGTAYYYAISYRVVLGTLAQLEAGGGTDLGFIRMSNVVKSYFSTEPQGVPRSSTGVPPDWYRTPRTIDLIPSLGTLIQEVSKLSAQFDVTTSSYPDVLKTSIAALEQQIASYQTLATTLAGSLSGLAALSSINLGSISVKTFAGSGGTQFVKQDIIKAFGDSSDPNRPAFDHDEFVTGAVILATSPSAISLLNMLFGGFTAATTEIGVALEKIDVALSALETAFFNDNFTTTKTPPVVAPKAFPQIGPGGYCYHSYTSDVTFDDTLQPRSP